MKNLTSEETNTILSFFKSPMRVNNIKSFTAPHLSSKANAVCHFCDDTGSILDDEHNKWPCPSCLHGTLKNVLHDNRQWAEHGDRFVRARTPEFIEALTKTNPLFATAILAELTDVPVDDEGNIETPFMRFEEGTHPEEIWHWLEKNFPPFSVAKALGMDTTPY